MSQLEHSPGPWRVKEGSVWDSHGEPVVHPMGGSEPGDATEGDLRLIAAAPEMYRILRIILEDKRRRLGLIEADAMAQAHRLIQELEGGSDAES